MTGPQALEGLRDELIEALNATGSVAPTGAAETRQIMTYLVAQAVSAPDPVPAITLILQILSIPDAQTES